MPRTIPEPIMGRAIAPVSSETARALLQSCGVIAADGNVIGTERQHPDADLFQAIAIHRQHLDRRATLHDRTNALRRRKRGGYAEARKATCDYNEVVDAAEHSLVHTAPRTWDGAYAKISAALDKMDPGGHSRVGIMFSALVSTMRDLITLSPVLEASCTPTCAEVAKITPDRLDCYPDAMLLHALAEIDSIADRLAIARRSSSDDYMRAIRRESGRYLELDRIISITQAKTLAGVHGKAVFVLRGEDLGPPSFGFPYVGALGLSAVHGAFPFLGRA